MTEASALSCWKVILSFTKFERTKVWGEKFGGKSRVLIIYLRQLFVTVQKLHNYLHIALHILCIWEASPSYEVQKLQAASFLGKVFLPWRMELSSGPFISAALAFLICKMRRFFFNHTLIAPFVGQKMQPENFRDDIYHCVSNLVTGFVNFMVPNLFMPSSLLLHLIDSAVPADSYASMLKQKTQTLWKKVKKLRIL